MNITFITPEYVTEIGFDGGLSNYLYKISNALVSRGHKVFIIVSSTNDEIIIRDNITVVRVSMHSNYLNLFKKVFRGKLHSPLYWLLQSWRLNKALKILHINTKIDIAQYSSYTGTAYFRQKVIPSVSRLSSYQPSLDKVNNLPVTLSRKIQYYLEKSALINSDSIYGPSSLIADIVEEQINKKIEIIETPITINKITNTNVYNKQLLNKKYLLFFGSLGVLKGLKEIAEILPKLFVEFPDIYFVFIGKDFGYKGKPMIDYIKAKAEKYKEKCIYLGSLEQEFLQPIIEYAQAVVLPSRIDNLPNTCIEAMAKGKIVIGTKGASFEQLITHKENGYLCEIENSASLYNIISEVLLLDEKIKEIIEANAIKRTQLLSPDTICLQLENFYKKTIQKKTINKIYIVNLKKDKEKKQHMQELCQKFNLEIEFIEAIYGKELSTHELELLYSDFKANKKLGRSLSQAEIGCALSHKKIYQKIIDENISEALILEDDIEFDKSLLDILNIKENFNDNWDVILLGHHTRNSRDIDTLSSFWQKKDLIGDYKLLRPCEIGYGTYGYLITQNGAKKLLKELSIIEKPIDHFTGDSQYINLYVINPAPIKIHEHISSSFHSMQERTELQKNLNSIRNNGKIRIIKETIKTLVVYKIFKSIDSNIKILIKRINFLRKYT